MKTFSLLFLKFKNILCCSLWDLRWRLLIQEISLNLNSRFTQSFLMQTVFYSWNQYFHCTIHSVPKIEIKQLYLRLPRTAIKPPSAALVFYGHFIEECMRPDCAFWIFYMQYKINRLINRRIMIRYCQLSTYSVWPACSIFEMCSNGPPVRDRVIIWILTFGEIRLT